MVKILLLFVLLAGCAGGQVWYHPTADQAEFERAKLYCDMDSRKMIPQYGSIIFQAIDQANYFKKCMRYKGYTH